jgi:hypothetical protein
MRDIEDINPLWRLADPLTVEQAAALIAGYDPNVVRYNAYDGGVYFENERGYTYTDSNGDHWVQTALAALKNAVNSGKLKARLIFSADPRYVGGIDNSMLLYRNGVDFSLFDDSLTGCEFIIKSIPDWDKTLIGRDDLSEWLESNGMKTGFFFPDSTDAPDYLDPKNSRYAPKLAAAVRVWQAMEDENLRRGKNPFSAMEQYLESRYKEYGLFHEKDNQKNGTVAGDINKTAISEVAKVANWQPGGGAPKTPGG